MRLPTSLLVSLFGLFTASTACVGAVWATELKDVFRAILPAQRIVGTPIIYVTIMPGPPAPPLSAAKSAADTIAPNAPIATTAIPTPVPTVTAVPPTSAAQGLTNTQRVASATAQQAWDELHQRAAIVFGVRFDTPPFGEDLSWRGKPCGPKENNQGFEPQGFDVELSREFVRRWFGDSSKIVFKCVTAADRIPALERRDVDFLLAALTPTNERCAKVVCSELYYVEDSIRLLAAKKNKANFVQRDGTSLYDLCNKKIAVLKGTTAKTVLEGDKIARCFNPAPIVELDTRAEAVEQVGKGIVDAYATDGLIVQALAEKDPETLIVLNGDYGKATSPLSIAVPQGEKGWQALVDLTLRAMNDDKWFQYYHDTFFRCQSSIPKMPSVDRAGLPTYVTRAGNPPKTNCGAARIVSGKTYQVQAGDTPGSIAREQLRDFSLWPCLLKVNNIDNPQGLPVRKITLPTKDECKS